MGKESRQCAGRIFGGWWAALGFLLCAAPTLLVAEEGPVPGGARGEEPWTTVGAVGAARGSVRAAEAVAPADGALLGAEPAGGAVEAVGATDVVASVPADGFAGLDAEEAQWLMEALAEDAAAPARPGAASPPGAGIIAGLQSMNPDIAVIMDVAGAWFSDAKPLQGGGHDPTARGFNLQQLEMSIGAAVDPFFRFDANLVFSLFGVEVEEVYGTTLALPWNLKARVGQFLTSFGKINATHPHTWSFVDQALVIGKFFGGEGNRGLGAELSWLSPLPWYVEVITSTTMATGDCCNRSYYGGQDLGVDRVDDLLWTVALKQFFPVGADLGIFWGLSGQFGPNPSGQGNRTEIYGTDLYVRYKPTQSERRTSLTLHLEALLRSRQVPGDVLQDYGGFAQVVWQIDPEWEVGVRGEWVSGLEEDPLDGDWTQGRGRYSAQFTYYPSHFSRLRAQVSLDDPRWRDAVIWAAFLALELVVGAHGSHSY